MKRRLHILPAIVLLLFLGACSQTKKLSEGDVLYTGVKKMKVEAAAGDKKVDSDIASAVKEPLNVKPNNPLYSPYMRTPFPFGLWSYNNFYTERQTGFRAWLFRNLGKKPVLIGDVQPEVRVKVVEDIMDNHGYFGGKARYELLPKKNPKKARINYFVEVPEPWHYSNIEYPAVTDPLTHAIDSLKATGKLHVGDRYDVDSIANERVRITKILRNDAYYYFRPEYIAAYADTTQQRYEVDLHLRIASGVPAAARRAYDIGGMEILINSSNGKGEYRDTTFNGIKIRYQEPLKVRPKVFRKALTIAPGEPANVQEINNTLNNLSRLGIFRYVNLGVTPLDSLSPADDKIDMTLAMAMDTPMDAELEVNFSQKSTSFIGPKAAFGVTHKNIFKGGELLSVKFNGGYEWQTGNTSSQVNSSTINSYELGANASLIFPRMISPRFLWQEKYPTRTTFQLGIDLLNRPRFFKMLSFNGSMSYDFQSSPRSYHNLTLFKLSYNRLLSTTADFEQTMAENEAIRRSFEDQFIPSASYTYTYDRKVGRNYQDRFTWQGSVMSAGNLLYAIYSAFGAKGTRKIFGNPFSQFAKVSSELKYHKKLTPGLTLASRFYLGIGHAYGNSTVIPYSEQFAIGGANSIRAFTIRSLGPGTYRPDEDQTFGYFDQTGTFKFEFNTELRMKLLGGLHGAVFFDAGNIWLLKDDPDRPGGKLQMKSFLRNLATGTGVGLRYDLDFLVIRADLGIGIHTPYTNPDKSGYYNIPTFKDGLGFHFAIGYPF